MKNSLHAKCFGFTLAEILITLGIIGVVAALTIPNLIEQSQESQWVAGLLKFNTNLQQAILLWKNDNGCNSDTKTCIGYENIADDDTSAFEKTFGQYMKISDKATGNYNTKSWLPNVTLNYYGDLAASAGFGNVAHSGSKNAVYLLQDGTTLSMDFTPPGFAMYVDVNGKRPPNRIGKDTFPITVGFRAGRDIYYFAYYNTAGTHNTLGLCPMSISTCDPDNVDPGVGNGANPTAYVMLNRKIPDYKALAAKYPGTFKP